MTVHIGRTGDHLCPVTAVLAYMIQRGSQPGPLFCWEDGRYLTREGFVTGVREALSAAGVEVKGYSGHSFRIGAAAQRGVQDSLIKTLGRWESSAYTRYIRTAPETLRRVAEALVQK